jgi:NitT/TauT family transport system permease protein
VQQILKPPRYFSTADLLILSLIGAFIYGLMSLGAEWRSDYHPVTEIDLSLEALPRYALFSAMRGLVAYCISLVFTLVVGYAAAKSKKAERIILPLLDIGQSIPVLGFLPGLVLGLIALFPDTNLGLELAAIIMIFTGQVWNMTFAFYSSLKSMPADYTEAARIMGLSWKQKFWRLELPFSATNLAWNSLISVAGGWFFLSVCEAFTLGNTEFLLPGVGAYMSVAIDRGDSRAMIYGVCAMILIIVTYDVLLWRPLLTWVRRFRVEEGIEVNPSEPLMLLLFRESRLIRWAKVIYRKNVARKLAQHREPIEGPLIATHLPERAVAKKKRFWTAYLKYLGPILWIGLALLAIMGSLKLGRILLQVPPSTWGECLMATGFTFLRIMAAIFLSTLWTVPVGLWIATSPERIRLAQPILQIFASFPAPMLYPLAVALFLMIGLDLNWGSILLMMLGAQWYVLFNVLAGALKISQELSDTVSMMQLSRWDRWKTLYLPSVFPNLVTGWVIAAGGSWNASIVAEYISYKGKILVSNGLGAVIHNAAADADFKLLAASLTLMVLVVITTNRTLWARLYTLAQTRYRMEV